MRGFEAQGTIGYMCNYKLETMESSIIEEFRKIKEKKGLPCEMRHRLQSTVRLKNTRPNRGGLIGTDCE